MSADLTQLPPSQRNDARTDTASRRWYGGGRGTWLLALACLCSSALAAAPSYTFEKPAFLGEPQVVRSLLGATYAYMPPSSDLARRLMITTMPVSEIRQQLGTLTEVQCANLFLDELRLSHERFFVTSMARPLTVGSREFIQFRWTGDKHRKTLTGVLSCGRIKGNYYVIHFVDELSAATHSFPSIRSSLKTLTPLAR